MIRDTWYDYEEGFLPKIQNCPFCGSECGLADNEYQHPVIDSGGTYIDMELSEADLFWCFCKGCRAFSDSFDSPEKAIISWNTRTLPKNTIQLPCKVGDEVWCVRDTRVYNKPVKGTVTEIYFRDNMDMCIVVRRLCRGRWGERVFATEQEAQAAIDRRVNDGKM